MRSTILSVYSSFIQTMLKRSSFALMGAGALSICALVFMLSVTATSAQETSAILVPGSGWSGQTMQPGPVGTSTDFGYTDNVIARWDTVPYQTIDTELHIGVVAFHNSGIEKVSFAVEGGAWLDVTSLSLNADTGVEEYVATLRAADFNADGRIEVRAIAYPYTGIPRLLDPLILSVNPNQTLPKHVVYVAQSGSDVSGDGSITNPYQTISRAISGIQARQGSDVGGGTIYVQPGEYVYGAPKENYSRYAANRWLTIAGAPGTQQGDVILTKAGSTAGVRTQKVRLHNLTISGFSIPSTANLSAVLWLDSVRYVGPGRTFQNSQPAAGPTVWTGGLYFTDSDFSNAQNGAVWGKIVRNVFVHDISSDAFQNSSLVVNSRAENISSAGTTFHPDVWQATSYTENAILYNVSATSSIGAQGLFADRNTPLKDIAFVNVNLNNQYPTTTVLTAFQFGATTTNMYVLNSSFVGRSIWRTDFRFVAIDVVLENSTFAPALNYAPGVVVR